MTGNMTGNMTGKNSRGNHGPSGEMGVPWDGFQAAEQFHFFSSKIWKNFPKYFGEDQNFAVSVDQVSFRKFYL